MDSHLPQHFIRVGAHIHDFQVNCASLFTLVVTQLAVGPSRIRIPLRVLSVISIKNCVAKANSST